GTNWVIECDSRSFHDDPNRYREDRRRDLALAERGYRVTRLTREQVFLQWGEPEQMLLTMLRRREHRRALPRRARPVGRSWRGGRRSRGARRGPRLAHGRRPWRHRPRLPS